MQNDKYVVTDPRKCQKHRQWMKKGQCDMCLLEKAKQQQQYEQQGGSNRPPVQIKKI